MRAVIVVLDVVGPVGRGDRVHCEKVGKVGRQRRIVGDAADVALEVPDVHDVEAQQGGDEADVGLRHLVAGEITLRGQPVVDEIERLEQRYHGGLVGLLRRREACLVHTVVDLVVDEVVDDIDFAAQRLGIIVLSCRAYPVERRVHHADDLGGFVRNDRAFLLVPKHRHSHSAGIIRLRRRVNFIEVVGVVDRIGDHAVARMEGDAVLAHQPVGD